MRRPAPTTATQPSTATNLDPAGTSETPQIQTVEPSAKPTGPVPPLNPDANTSIQPADVVTQPNHDKARDKALPEQDATAEDRGIQHDLHKRKFDAISHDSREESPPNITATERLPVESATPTLQLPRSFSPVTQTRQPPASVLVTESRSQPSIGGLPQVAVSGSTQSTRPEHPPETGPATKQRRIASGQQKAPSRQWSVSEDQVAITSSSTEATTSAGPTRAATREPHVLPTAATRIPSAIEKRKQPDQSVIIERLVKDTGTSTRRATGPQAKAKVRRPRRAAKARSQQQIQEAAAEIVADAVERTTARRKGRRHRKERQPTPEEAEDETIEPGRIKMADLCKDSQKGKKSDMLRALQERDMEQLMEKKQKELQQLVGDEGPAESEVRTGAANTAAERGVASGCAEKDIERRQEVARQVAGTYVNEHGEIMIDTDSLQVDRHAQAAAEREQGQLEAVEENFLSRPAVNSQTYAKREKPNSWSEELTDEFYDALRMFGTDFDMIGRMLRKTRRAIKLKFNREERLDPDRINQTLLGERIAVDVEDFSRRAGEELKETEEHERMMEEDRKKIEDTVAEELRAKEDQEQLRKDQAEQEGAGVPDESSGKENREIGKKKEKRKKGMEGGEKTKRRKKKGKVVEKVP